MLSTDQIVLEWLWVHVEVSALGCRQKATDVDDEYDVDGGLDMYEAKRKRGNKVHVTALHAVGNTAFLLLPLAKSCDAQCSGST